MINQLSPMQGRWFISLSSISTAMFTTDIVFENAFIKIVVLSMYSKLKINV